MASPSLASAKYQRSKAFFVDDGKPTWEIAYLFPAQGTWTVKQYLKLEHLAENCPLIEYDHGRIEVVTMPTEIHQFIMIYLMQELASFAALYAPGTVLCAGMKVRLKKRLFRQPDVLYLKQEHDHLRGHKFWLGADLVMEVVSDDPKDRRRDLQKKRREYAAAGIREDWVVDPASERITVLVLDGGTYRVHGEFGPGSVATSVLLPSFQVSVDTALHPPGSKTATP
jgi:Uma2 family endonuclease